MTGRQILGAFSAVAIVGLLGSAAPTQAGPPGGKGKIAFVSTRDGDGEIYVMNADGTGVTQLTNNIAIDVAPHWSPDGKKIAFSSDRDGDFEIYVMNADGTGVTQLTNNLISLDIGPSWSSH